MQNTSPIISLVPVLPSANIERDTNWYATYLGFTLTYKEEGYVVLKRDHYYIHLQWHANTEEDPVYGSVIKFFVDDIMPFFKEMLEYGIITEDKLHLNTPWNTNEFGFYDLNKNAIYFVESH